jgi:hypothetical protein
MGVEQFTAYPVTEKGFVLSIPTSAYIIQDWNMYLARFV